MRERDHRPRHLKETPATRTVRRWLPAALAAAGIAALALGLPAVAREHADVSVLESLARDAKDDTCAEGTIDWDGLRERNPDVCAWVFVEGAGIDLPVVQAGPASPTWWLDHDLDGNESVAGVPFVDARCSARSSHVLCLGHHLALTGGVFSGLRTCFQQEAFEHICGSGLVWSCPEDGNVAMRALCAATVEATDELAQRTTFADTGELRAWLASIVERASAVAPNAPALAARAERAVTLITCSSLVAGQSARTVVTFVA